LPPPPPPTGGGGGAPKGTRGKGGGRGGGGGGGGGGHTRCEYPSRVLSSSAKRCPIPTEIVHQSARGVRTRVHSPSSLCRCDWQGQRVLSLRAPGIRCAHWLESDKSPLLIYISFPTSSSSHSGYEPLPFDSPSPFLLFPLANPCVQIWEL